VTQSPTPAALSEEERRRVFAAALEPSPTSGLKGGRIPIPPRVVWWVALCFVVLGVGGAIAEHFVGAGSAGVPAPPDPAGTSALNALLSYKALPRTYAPSIVLTDQRGRAWSLRSQLGHPVVLFFMNQRCNDLCPVISSEISDTLKDLGTSSGVRIAVINTDPRDLGVLSNSPAQAALGSSARSVEFLTGPLSIINYVWASYGVQVEVDKNGQVVHNDVAYFIDRAGRLNALAVPFGNESRNGRFTLSTSNIEQFALGVANVATSLDKP